MQPCIWHTPSKRYYHRARRRKRTASLVNGGEVIEPANAIASEHSSALEKLLEHLFVGDLLRCLWAIGARDMEVLRGEVDRGGCDVVLEANGVLRYLQLKASHATAKAKEVKINTNLARKPGG